MWQQLDELTGLLNQKSYLNQTASLSQDGTLVVFDIDDFKHINDNLHKDMKINSLQRFHHPECPPRHNSTQD